MALRVVVAGLGSRGLDWARTLQTSAVAALVGAADPDPQARAAAASEPALATVPVEPDLDRLLARTNPQAVIVAAPAGYHAPLTEQAIAHGLGVLVEKPFTLDLASGARLVRMADARGVPLLVAQNHRYMRAHRTVRRIVNEGVLGRLSAVSCHYWRATHVTNAHLSANDMSALWETGVHHLDALRYCLGRRVVGVAADVSTAPWVKGLQGTSSRVLLEFEDGLRGEYSVSWEAPGHEFFEAGQQFYERLTGERGTLHVVQRWLVLCLSGSWPRFVGRGRRAESEEAALLRQLAAAQAGEMASECSGRDNLQTLAVLAACREAWRTRRWINPQELLEDVGA